jgi:hypothetical protein
MTYNLVKTSIPSLIDKQLAMKIAKINNIDYSTGIALPELPKPPSQFELLCGDIKESIFLFIRKNIMTIVIVIIVSILLTIRYYQVKREKNEILKRKNNNLPINNLPNNNLPNNNLPNNLPNNEIDTLRQSFNEYNDNNARKCIMDNIYQNNSTYDGVYDGFYQDKMFAPF